MLDIVGADDNVYLALCMNIDHNFLQFKPELNVRDLHGRLTFKKFDLVHLGKMWFKCAETSFSGLFIQLL
jgi:hypothetical protein